MSKSVIATSNVANSVFGTWMLIKDPSDLIPPFESLEDSPLSCAFTGNKGDELVLMSRHDFNGIEEIIFEGKANEEDLFRTYQLGKLNIEKYNNSKVIIAIVVGIFSEFESFIIIRYGPSPNSQSSEKFSVDPENNILKIETDIILPNGTTSQATRYFNRKLPAKNISKMGITPARCIASFGWLYQDFRSKTMLETATVQVLDAWSIISPKLKIKGSALGHFKITDGLQITRSFGNKLTDGETVIVFLVQVNVGGKSWSTVHRYREFDALRLFIESRKHLRSERYWKRVGGSEPTFPRKRAMSMTLSMDSYPQYIKDRIGGLQAFMNFHCKLGGHEVQSIIDALCSFLEIPEHLKSAEEAVKATKESALPPDDSIATIKVEKKNSAMSFFAVGNTHADAKRDSLLVDGPFAPKKASSTFVPTSTKTHNPSFAEEITNAPLKSAMSKPVTNSGEDDISIRPSKVDQTPNVLTARNVQTLAASSQNVSYKDLSGLSMVSPLVMSQDTVFKYPQDALYAVLQSGLIVIKHGRQGKPKRRLIRSNSGVTRLYWGDVPEGSGSDPASQDLPSESKSFVITEAIEIRRGTDEDNDDGSVSGSVSRQETSTTDEEYNNSKTTKNRRNSFFSLGGGGKPSDIIKYGTKTLRKNKLSFEEMRVSFSIILKDRSFDIQCLNEKDFTFLYNNLLNYWKLLVKKNTV